jgi:hypothetical protein
VGEQEKDEGNSINDIRKFLTTPENPLPMAEFMAFWKDLTDEEKAEFKKTPLPS